jgi:hypothetical protein
MKLKRTLAGGLVVLGIAVGAYFANLFRGLGFGLGPGSGGIQVSSGDGAEGRDDVSQPETAPSTNATATDSAAERNPQGIPVPPSPGILDVIIAGETYETRQMAGEEERVESIELPAIVERAKQAAGGADGVRVRIFRRESSLPTSEEALDQALSEAGIPPDAIHRAETLLPDR